METSETQVERTEAKEKLWIPSEYLRFLLEESIGDLNVMAILPHYYDLANEANGPASVFLIHINDFLSKEEEESSRAYLVDMVNISAKTMGLDNPTSICFETEGLVNYMQIHGGYDSSLCWYVNRESWNMASENMSFLKNIAEAAAPKKEASS